MVCPKCGYALDSFEKECPRCAKAPPPEPKKPEPPRSEDRPGPVPMGFRAQEEKQAEDKLEGYWYAIVWCSLLVPLIGGWIIVVLSSVMYYVWKKDFPNKARAINRQGWLAFFLGNLLGLLLYFAFGQLLYFA